MAIALRKNQGAVALQDNRHSVRSERIQNVFNVAELCLELNGKRYRVDNFSETGVAVQLPEAPVQGHETEGKIFLNEKCLYSGGMMCAWARQKDGSWFAGLSLTQGYLPENLYMALSYFDELSVRLQQVQRDSQSVPDQFIAVTAQLKNFLRATKHELDAIENQLEAQSLDTYRAFDATFEGAVAPQFLSHLRDYNKKLDGIFKGMDKPTRKECVKYFRQEVGEFYLAGPFINRAMQKPQGYAGDYEMMNQIYDSRPLGKGLFAKLMHLYGINEFSSQSVRYRKGYFIKHFQSQLTKKTGPLVFGSVACGPAREIVDFLSLVTQDQLDRIEFILMDQDHDALLNAKKNVNRVLMQRGLKGKFTFAPISVKDLLEHGGMIQMIEGRQFDFIYTAGLYDYLTQPVAKILTGELLGRVKTDGMMIIGNFHPDNPTKTISELSCDWRLIHRDETMMLDLVSHTTTKGTRIHFDDLKIDVFLEIDR